MRPRRKRARRPVTSRANAPKSVNLLGRPLTLEDLEALLDRPIRVRIGKALRKRIDASAQRVRRLVDGEAAIYGVNTGVGRLCTRRIPVDQLETLQSNLIVSHAVGVGDPVPIDIVRWMMLLKAHSFTRGVSGITWSTLACLIRLLEADVLPVIPSQGSLGASGDLAPLAHLVLPMIGLGFVNVDGEKIAAGVALKRLGISPIKLRPKEGLALINGTQFMTAYAAHVIVRARRLMKHADVMATMSLEAIRGSIKPFDKRLHQLRPHPGAVEAANNVRRMMAGSEILKSHADCDRVQDPYSIRCVPQVHGASRDAWSHAAETVEREINSVTDNPIIFENGDVVSGGLFHGQPVALVLDYLAIALAELASISERRIYLLLSGAGGLPELLMKDTGLNSGFMLPQYTAAALVSENKGLCMPASVDSIPTSLGQEDHVSMGARSATKCLQILANAETVLAIEQMCAAQALDYHAPLKPGIGPRLALAEIRKHVKHSEKDRLLGDDIQKSLSLLRSNDVVRVVERKIGTLY